MCVHVCTCVFVYTCVYMYVCLCVCLCTCVCVLMCLYLCVYISVWVGMCVCRVAGQVPCLCSAHRCQKLKSLSTFNIGFETVSHGTQILPFFNRLVASKLPVSTCFYNLSANVIALCWDTQLFDWVL